MAKKPLSKARAITERGSRHDEGMTREEMEREPSAPGSSPRPTPRPKKKFQEGGQVSTRRMPSGAQQYTRGDTEIDRLQTNSRAFNASRSASKITDAMVDEFNRDQAAERNESQTRREDRTNRLGTKMFADGGMVRGCKPGQMSGKGFRGTY